MPVVSAGNLTYLRQEGHRSNVYLSFLVPPILWKARINDASIVKGETSIIFDGGAGSAFSLVGEWQEVWVGTADEGNDVGRLRIKSISSGDGGVTGTLTVAGHSHALGDDQYLTFKLDYPLKPRRSFVSLAEVWYMDDDITYTDEHSKPQPIVIAGSHRADFLSSGSVTFNVDASNSYPIASGASISSYALSVITLQSAPTINFSGVTGLGDITFTEAGVYWAKYSTTDSNGKIRDSFRCYIIHDPDRSQGSYPFLDISSLVLEGDWETGGYQAAITVHDNSTLAEIPDHTLLIIWSDDWFGATNTKITFLPDNPKTAFVGYVRSDQSAQDWAEGFGEVDIVASTIEGVLRNLFSFSTSVKADQSVTDWYLAPSWQYIGSLLEDLFGWRSTLLVNTDVIGLADNTLRRAYGGFDEGNIYDMGNNIAYNEGIRSRLVCDQGGRLHLSEDQQLLPDTERGALTTIFDIVKSAGASDYGGLFVTPRQPEFRAPFVTSDGIYWDGTWTVDDDGLDVPAVNEYCSISPGGKPLWRGAEPQDFPKQTVSSQDHLNKITGRFEAKVNNEFEEVRIEFPGNYHGVLDPAYSEQFTISLQAGDTPRGIVKTDWPLFLRNVRSTYENGYWSCEASFEPEQEGTEGVTTQCPSFPELGGTIPDITLPEEQPGALMTGASVNFKSAAGNSWDQRIAQAVRDLIADPFWRSKQGSSSPNSAIAIRCGVGFIRRSTDAFNLTDVSVTPSTDPPNTAGDSPAPTAGTVTYEHVDSSWISQDEHLFVANWQNSGGDWRSWAWFTANDFTSGTWIFLGETATGCADPGTSYNLTGWFGQGNGTAYKTSGELAIVKLNTNLFVILNGSSARAIEVNPSTKAITVGAASSLPSTLSSEYICKTSTTQFAAVIRYDGAGPPTASPATVIVDVNPSTLALTVGSAQALRTNYEETNITSLWSQGSDITLVAPSSGNLTVIFYGDALNPSTCASGNYGYYVMTGTISGRSVTWPDTTCSGNTIRDLTTVYSLSSQLFSTGGNHGKSFLIDMEDGSTWCFALRDPVNSTSSNRDIYVVHGSGSTLVGSPVRINMDDYTLGEIERGIVRLDSTHAVLVFQDDSNANPGVGYEALYAVRLTLGGGGITVGSIQTLWDKGDLEEYPIGHSIFALDSDEFGLVWKHGGVFFPNCSIAARYSVSGDTITEQSICENWLEVQSSNEDIVVAGWDADEWVNCDDTGIQGRARIVSKSDLDTCIGPSGDSYGLGANIGKSSGNKAWITIGNGSSGILELLELALPGLTISNRYSLGNAALSQIIGIHQLVARPFVPFGFDDFVIVYGRMDNPQSLGTPCHIIKTTNGGSSWAVIENLWAGDHCGALIRHTTGVIFAIRNRGGSSKLYKDNADESLVVKVTLPFPAEVAPHGMALDFYNGVIYACAWLPNSVMVAKIPPPYFLATDLTYNHDTSNSIESIVIL